MDDVKTWTDKEHFKALAAAEKKRTQINGKIVWAAISTLARERDMWRERALASTTETA